MSIPTHTNRCNPSGTESGKILDSWNLPCQIVLVGLIPLQNVRHSTLSRQWGAGRDKVEKIKFNLIYSVSYRKL